MADKKISELVALTAANFATDDLFAVVDTSATETKKTTIADLDARYASSGVTQYTDELAQDAVGTILADSATIDFTYTDLTPSITAAVVAGSIGNTELGTGLDASKIGSGGVSSAEFDFLANVSSDIQTQLNGKQASGNYITAVTGDITATGPGSVAGTLATVNAGVGSFTRANITVNAKGLVTAAASGAAVALASEVSGILPVANGGTNASGALSNNRVMQSSAGAIVEAAAITASRALVSDTNGIPVASSVTSTTLAFLDATSSVQTQLDAKQTTTLTDGNILVGNASNVATSVNPSGDVDVSNAGAFTIQPGVVTYAKMQTFGANKFIANNTGSTAAPTEQAYDHPDPATYSGTITWTGTTPPSGATTHEFVYEKTGKWATLTISLKYASAGTTLQAVAMEFPAGAPSPKELSGNTGASDRLWPGAGWLETTSSSAAGAARCYIRRNSGDTAYEIFIQAGAGNYAFAEGTVRYMVA